MDLAFIIVPLADAKTINPTKTAVMPHSPLFGFAPTCPTVCCLLLTFHRPSKIEIGSYACDVKRVTTTSGAVLMKKIGVQHEDLFVWPLHAARVLVFVPRVVIAIPEQLAGRIRREANLPNLERPIDCQPVAIAKIVSSGIPAKLNPVAILSEEAEPKNIFRRCLQQEAVFAFAATILVGHDELVTGAQD